MTLEDLIRRDEGLRLTPYPDSMGKTTIGYGRNLSDVGISRNEADFLLANDISKAKLDTGRAFPWSSKLDDARLAVLVSLVFNMGVGKVKQFKNTLAYMEAGHYEEAANGMLHSLWAEQVKDRAIRLAEQMKTGIWQ